MVKSCQLSCNTYSTLGTSASIIMVWATAYIRCFLRIEIACMCHVVNYTLLYGRHRSEYHFGLNAFERNEIISINWMFLKSVIHFIFVCFHAIFKLCKNKHGNHNNKNSSSLLLESIYCQHVKYQPILMSTDPIKPKHKTFKFHRKFTQLYLNQLLIITTMYQTLYESYVLCAIYMM